MRRFKRLHDLPLTFASQFAGNCSTSNEHFLTFRAARAKFLRLRARDLGSGCNRNQNLLVSVTFKIYHIRRPTRSSTRVHSQKVVCLIRKTRWFALKNCARKVKLSSSDVWKRKSLCFLSSLMETDLRTCTFLCTPLRFPKLWCALSTCFVLYAKMSQKQSSFTH